MAGSRASWHNAAGHTRTFAASRSWFPSAEAGQGPNARAYIIDKRPYREPPLPLSSARARSPHLRYDPDIVVTSYPHLASPGDAHPVALFLVRPVSYRYRLIAGETDRFPGLTSQRRLETRNDIREG